MHCPTKYISPRSFHRAMNRRFQISMVCQYSVLSTSIQRTPQNSHSVLKTSGMQEAQLLPFCLFNFGWKWLAVSQISTTISILEEQCDPHKLDASIIHAPDCKYPGCILVLFAIKQVSAAWEWGHCNAIWQSQGKSISLIFLRGSLVKSKHPPLPRVGYPLALGSPLDPLTVVPQPPPYFLR